MVKVNVLKSSVQADSYFKKDFANGQEQYYSQEGQTQGVWEGRLAQEWGLSGSVTREEFENLMEGKHPETGEQLVRNVGIREYTDGNGEKKETGGHRAGWDITISAPKSVSAAAILGDDERIRELHRDSVEEAMKAAEELVQARMGGDRGPQHTGNMAAVSFEHTSARPVDGYSSPDLHTHFVVANMTETDDGKYRSIESQELYNAQRSVMEATYRSHMAYGLEHQLGYTVERGPYGEPEIQGYSRDWIEEVSKRSGQIREKAAELGLESIEARDRIALSTREGKHAIDPEKTRQVQQEIDRKHGIDHAQIVVLARERGQRIVPHGQRIQAAREAVTYARDHNLERDATVSERRLFRDALDRGQGIVKPEDIRQEMAGRERAGELVQRGQKGLDRVLTTEREIGKEHVIIDLMKQGRNTQKSFVNHDRWQRLQLEPEFRRLNEAQLEVAHQVLTNRDRIQGIQGSAGTGKTTLLEPVIQELERAGHEVKGLAPTTGAAARLAESGAATETLQKHVQRGQGAHQHAANRVYLVDESSLASSRMMQEFTARLQPNERVILIGDQRQHQAVEAGVTFEQLQREGMATAELDSIVRQKTEWYREAVSDLARGRVAAGLEKLDAHLKVHEIAGECDRIRATVKQYREWSQGPEIGGKRNAIMVTPDHASRNKLNAKVRSEMRKAGEIGQDERPVQILDPRNEMTGANRKWAAQYEVGNVLRYQQDSPEAGIQRGDYATVTVVDIQRNRITVEFNGRSVEYDPRRRSGVEVYRESERGFSTGDQIRFTRPWHENGINNGDTATIRRIDGDDNFQVQLHTDGRELRFHRDANRHIDYAYAGTSQALQGATVERVVGYVDTANTNPQLIHSRLAYTGTSRGQYDVAWFTDDKNKFRTEMAAEYTKTTAIEMPGETGNGAEGRSPKEDRETKRYMDLLRSVAENARLPVAPERQQQRRDLAESRRVLADQEHRVQERELQKVHAQTPVGRSQDERMPELRTGNQPQLDVPAHEQVRRQEQQHRDLAAKIDPAQMPTQRPEHGKAPSGADESHALSQAQNELKQQPGKRKGIEPDLGNQIDQGFGFGM